MAKIDELGQLSIDSLWNLHENAMALDTDEGDNLARQIEKELASRDLGDIRARQAKSIFAKIA